MSEVLFSFWTVLLCFIGITALFWYGLIHLFNLTVRLLVATLDLAERGCKNADTETESRRT